MHGNVKEILDVFLLVQRIPIFVKKFGPSEVFFTNKQLLVWMGMVAMLP
jgi:hypothetical protein